ncbi:MAG: hypothetical protein ABSG41_27550 [Bryobacteraceae bacterium]|jgi:hypothetical protein
MIEVKTAVQKALGYFQELMPASAPGSILLEEVEFAEGPSPRWHITFSTPSPQLTLASISGRDRAYKTITIDAETGEFRSMKIRPLPVPA